MADKLRTRTRTVYYNGAFHVIVRTSYGGYEVRTSTVFQGRGWIWRLGRWVHRSQ